MGENKEVEQSKEENSTPENPPEPEYTMEDLQYTIGILHQDMQKIKEENDDLKIKLNRAEKLKVSIKDGVKVFSRVKFKLYLIQAKSPLIEHQCGVCEQMKVQGIVDRLRGYWMDLGMNQKDFEFIEVRIDWVERTLYGKTPEYSRDRPISKEGRAFFYANGVARINAFPSMEVWVYKKGEKKEKVYYQRVIGLGLKLRDPQTKEVVGIQFTIIEALSAYFNDILLGRPHPRIDTMIHNVKTGHDAVKQIMNKKN
jgi:hypothetical protein